MLEYLKPYVRALKYHHLYKRALKQARKLCHWDPEAWHRPPVYIVGCGRSGTTILGQLLSGHSHVRYYFEPYHLWAAIDRHTDMTNLYTAEQPKCFLNQSDVASESKQRFEAVFGESLRSSQSQVIEKTPIHALRLTYLAAIAPGARFIHLRRKCAPVANSIQRLAEGNTYKIYGKKTLNQWWGVDDIKWKTLVLEGANAGIELPEVGLELEDHWMRGVYEWYCTERSIEQALEEQPALREKILTVTYEELVENPSRTLSEIETFASLDHEEQWCASSSECLSPRTRSDVGSRQLPLIVQEYESKLYANHASAPAI
jgi:Sulfotransferase family